MVLPDIVQTSPFVIIDNNPNTTEREFFSYFSKKYLKLEEEYIKILEFCRTPKKMQELKGRFDSSNIDELVECCYLQNPSDFWTSTNTEYIDIEINTHCNWRCEYCPVSFDPKSPKNMPMELFSEILEKAERHPMMKYVSFVAYNEPTLDVHFDERVKRLAETKLKLILHTNGSFLDKHKTDLLVETGVVDRVMVNIPSIEEEEMKRLTGVNTYKKTLQNMEYAIACGLNVGLVVNGTIKEIKNNLSKIKEKYASLLGDRIYHYGTFDSAGLMKNRYSLNIDLKGNLPGCTHLISHIYVGVNGECFICCMDYYQRYIYANIRDGEISDILNCEQAQLFRKQTFGAVTAPNDFICRKCWSIMLSRTHSKYSKNIKPIF